MPTKYILFFDDTYTRSWSWILEDDDGKEWAQSNRRYLTKAAAASVAAGFLRRWRNV